jgi:hypothetical protein
MFLFVTYLSCTTSSWAQIYDEEEAIRRIEEREDREIREMNEMAFSVIFWLLFGGGAAYIVARGIRR